MGLLRDVAGRSHLPIGHAARDRRRRRDPLGMERPRAAARRPALAGGRATGGRRPLTPARRGDGRWRLRTDFPSFSNARIGPPLNSNNIDLARLRATLDTAELSWLISRLRQRLERGEGLEGVVTLRDPTPGQRAAVDRLLGRRPSGGATLTLDLMDLDRQLRHAELCDGRPAAIEALCGPLENLREQQLQGEQQWQRLFAEAAHRAGASRDLQLWLDELRATGLLRRLSGQQLDAARRLLDQTFDLLARLPARGLPLAELAVAVSGDSHTLDPGRPLATIALRAAAQLAGVDHRHDAEARRDAWAGVGVLCDELSAPLLLLNLRGDNGSLTGRALSS